MSKITYKPGSYESVIVFLENKIVGTIRKVADGYQYTPKGKKAASNFSGEVMATLRDVKNSLEAV